MENVKERVKKAVMEWDVMRLRSELLMYIDQDTDDGLKESYFDDIATEDELELYYEEEAAENNA